MTSARSLVPDPTPTGHSAESASATPPHEAGGYEPCSGWSAWAALASQISGATGVEIRLDLKSRLMTQCVLGQVPAQDASMALVQQALLQLATGDAMVRAQLQAPESLIEHHALALPLSVDGVLHGLVLLWSQGRSLALAPELAASLMGVAASLLQGHLTAERLRLQETRLNGASAAASDWLWESDETGAVTWVTGNVRQKLGIGPDESLGLSARDIYTARDDEYAESWQRYLDARARREPFFNAVGDRDTPNGRITVSFSGTPWFDEHGRFRGYRGSSRDVTAELAAQRDSLERQRLMAYAIESFPGAVFVSDAQGRIVLSNRSWRRSVAHVIDKVEPTWANIVRAMVADGFYPDAIGNEEAFVQWRLSLASPEPARHELRLRAGWSIVSDHVLPDGNVIHLFIDITQRKRYELALAESEAELRLSQDRLQAVLQALPDLWMVLDREGACLQCPVDEHPLLPEPFSLLAGRPVQEIFPDALGEPLRAALQAWREQSDGEAQAGSQRLEAEFAIGADDQLRTIEVRLAPMPHGQVLFLARDLTELSVLRRDVELLERVLEADVSLPLMLVDATSPRRRFVYCNPAFERLLGVRRTELLGQDWRVLVGPGKDNAAHSRAVEQAMLAGQIITVVLEQEVDGQRMLTEWHMSPVRDSRDQVSHFIFVVKDCTEQARAADKLRVSEELYRSVAAAISDGLIVVTLDGRVAAVNPAACRILGTPHEELLGRREPYAFTLLDGHLQPARHEQFPVQRVLTGGQPVVDEVWAVRRPDGEVRWLSVGCHPLRLDPDQTLFSAVATFRDITDTRQAARALRVSEERWKFALEGAGHGVWDWDIANDRTFYSQQWKALLGYAEEEVGEQMQEGLDRIHPEDRQLAVSALRRHLGGETDLYQAEYRIRHKAGHDLWVLDRGKVVSVGSDGRPARMVGTLSDITQAKAAEQALRDKQAAELASQAKSQFLSRMSHEMRTPLNAMLGFAQLIQLEPEASPETHSGYVGHILQAGQHLLALINDVLDLQRVEEGRLSMDLQALELSQVVSACVDLLRPQAENQQVQVSCRVEPGVFVFADARRLRQVLLNVGSNAVKYNRAGGEVRWEVDHVGVERVVLSIEDEGAGLTPEQAARLFQPFERLGKETSNIEGTGLGLIIARGLIEEMGGTLVLRSRAGIGTRVTIELPRHLAMKPDSRESWPHEVREGALPVGLAAMAAIPGPATGQPLKLLYVEDNRINALLFEQALHVHSNIELRVAEDGQQALEMVQDWKPDVLVLDAHLPGMSGYEALQALRSLPDLEHVPAFMCSADAMPEDVARATSAGFEGYWTKPIDIAQVLADLGRMANSLQRQAAPAPAA